MHCIVLGVADGFWTMCPVASHVAHHAAVSGAHYLSTFAITFALGAILFL